MRPHWLFGTFTSFVLAIAVCMPLSKAQSPVTGIWQGAFMDDFKTELDLENGEDGALEGRIRMYAGADMIQDDELDRIKLLTNQLIFDIPAKQTSFEGTFNEQLTELAGSFVFPDGSVHPIHFNKRGAYRSSSEHYQERRNKTYSKKELVADLEFLYANLRDHHPDLYAHISADALGTLLNRLEDMADSSLSLHQFYLLASELTDAVGCSHTGVVPPGSYQTLSEEQGNFFPLKLYFKGDEAFYISTCVDEANIAIAPGSEIISINRTPAAEIIRQLSGLVPSEGNNTTTKYRALNTKFNRLYYYLDDSDDFLVKYSDGGNADSTIVPACRMDAMGLLCSQKSKGEQLKFEFIDNRRVGVLTIPSFAIRDLDKYFQDLDSVFNILGDAKTRNLVLDLRDNKGGHPIFAAQLFSYLTQREFVYFKRNEDIEEFEPLYDRMQPNERKFDGNLYVFVNGGCLSTTGHLISLLKYYTNALFIGEQPGSTYRCNDFSIQLKLPNTGLEVNVPRTTFETTAGGLEQQKAFPLDYEVQNNVSSVLNSEDTYFGVLEDIIRK